MVRASSCSGGGVEDPRVHESTSPVHMQDPKTGYAQVFVCSIGVASVLGWLSTACWMPAIPCEQGEQLLAAKAVWLESLPRRIRASFCCTESNQLGLSPQCQ